MKEKRIKLVVIKKDFAPVIFSLVFNGDVQMSEAHACSSSTFMIILQKLKNWSLKGVSSLSKDKHYLFLPPVKVLKPEFSFLSLLT